MTAKNDITGDSIATKKVTDEYRNNYDLIFGKKKKESTNESKDEAVVEQNSEENLPKVKHKF